jgi:ribonucleotide monophosphatase NagD (HAD superfamily)
MLFTVFVFVFFPINHIVLLAQEPTYYQKRYQPHFRLSILIKSDTFFAFDECCSLSRGHFLYIKTGLFVAVVLGATVSYSFERLSTALRLVAAGARFIATNPVVIGSSEQGAVLACGAVAAMIAAATGVQPYSGKPNPLMMRSALRCLRVPSEDTVMIGDRMDTTIVTGTESGIETVLVLIGVTRREEVERFLYRPARIVEFVTTLPPDACNIERR